MKRDRQDAATHASSVFGFRSMADGSERSTNPWGLISAPVSPSLSRRRLWGSISSTLRRTCSTAFTDRTKTSRMPGACSRRDCRQDGPHRSGGRRQARLPLAIPCRPDDRHAVANCGAAARHQHRLRLVAQEFELSAVPWLDHAGRYDRAEEFLRVFYGLFNPPSEGMIELERRARCRTYARAAAHLRSSSRGAALYVGQRTFEPGHAHDRGMGRLPVPQRHVGRDAGAAHLRRASGGDQWGREISIAVNAYRHRH